MKDKSLFFYGSAYHRFIDPTLIETHRTAASLIPDGSRVLDIACGTGVFATMLREQKNCQVHGIDLSRRMLEFAIEHNSFPEITFQHKDATDLNDFATASFDFATMQMLLHEITLDQQKLCLGEALRVAKKVVLIDYHFPLSKNATGMLMRLTEVTIGRNHYPNFRAFLAHGGIQAILRDLNLPVRIEHHDLISLNCRDVFVLTI
jgi:ubiquinone/menaquinone biosynthesis C-methylase UbiE